MAKRKHDSAQQACWDEDWMRQREARVLALCEDRDRYRAAVAEAKESMLHAKRQLRNVERQLDDATWLLRQAKQRAADAAQGEPREDAT